MQLTKSLAVAWAKDNIQVNAVLPGWIDTDLTAKAREEVSGLNAMVLMRTPAKRWGKPDDHAGVAVFLASRGQRFRHRHGHPRRRGLFGAGLGGFTQPRPRSRRGCVSTAISTPATTPAPTPGR